MACGLALKRPLELESLHGPEGVKRSRTTGGPVVSNNGGPNQLQMSPYTSAFQQKKSPPKDDSSGSSETSPFSAASLSSMLPTTPTTSSSSRSIFTGRSPGAAYQHQPHHLHSRFFPPASSSVFTPVGTKLTTEQLEKYLRAEIKALRRRQALPSSEQQKGKGKDVKSLETTPQRASTSIGMGGKWFGNSGGGLMSKSRLLSAAGASAAEPPSGRHVLKRLGGGGSKLGSDHYRPPRSPAHWSSDSEDGESGGGGWGSPSSPPSRGGPISSLSSASSSTPLGHRLTARPPSAKTPLTDHNNSSDNDEPESHGSDKKYHKSQFSFQQVQMICERLLREQEDRLRIQYDAALNNKLAEQYESFCRFTQDQVYRHTHSDETPSYLS